MAKFALALLVTLCLAGVAFGKPFGGGAVVSQNHVSSSVLSPHYGMGMGYGMMGYPGLGGLGHTISTHSISHAAVPHYGFGMMGIKGNFFWEIYQLI